MKGEDASDNVDVRNLFQFLFLNSVGIAFLSRMNFLQEIRFLGPSGTSA